MSEQRAETRFDIHQHITNQIVAAIEAGAGEFRLPWHRAAGSIMRPVNVASKKPYQGVNILTLWAAGDAAGYEAGVWGTYKQWAEAGAQVRKGEKASYIVFYKEITVAAEEGDEDDTGTRLFARATPIFAAEQVDGYSPPARGHRGIFPKSYAKELCERSVKHYRSLFRLAISAVAWLNRLRGMLISAKRRRSCGKSSASASTRISTVSSLA